MNVPLLLVGEATVFLCPNCVFSKAENAPLSVFRCNFASMICSSSILVLRTIRHKDDQLIAECISPTLGRISLLVRISHARRATVRHTLFQPLAVLEAEWEGRGQASLVRPKAVRTLVPFATLHSDPVKTCVSLFLAEFLTHVARSEEISEALYDYTVHSLLWLDTAEKDYANFHLVFLMRLSQFVGLHPNLEHADLPFFDLLAAEFVPMLPRHTHYIQREEARAFAQLMRMHYDTMHLFSLSRTQRWRIVTLILEYYRLHLGAMPELKSLEIMREVFNA